jgi:hypothetical protein
MRFHGREIDIGSFLRQSFVFKARVLREGVNEWGFLEVKTSAEAFSPGYSLSETSFVAGGSAIAVFFTGFTSNGTCLFLSRSISPVKSPSE